MYKLSIPIRDRGALDYTFPDPKGLDSVAAGWWAGPYQIVTGESSERKKSLKSRGQFSLSLAAAFEIRSGHLGFHRSDLSKACFFRQAALNIAETRPDVKNLSALKAKYATSLLVKATHVDDEPLVQEALRLARAVIGMETMVADTKMMLACVLLWLVNTSGLSEKSRADLDMALKYIEECRVESPLEFEYRDDSTSLLSMALQMRYILTGSEQDMQQALNLARTRLEESGSAPNNYDVEEKISSYVLTISLARQKFTAGETGLGDSAQETGLGSFKARTDEMNKMLQSSQRNFNYSLLPGKIREAQEATMLVLQRSQEGPVGQKDTASNFSLGMHYARSVLWETGGAHSSNYERAISHLEAARMEEATDARKRLDCSVCIASSRLALAEAKHDTGMLDTALREMNALLDDLSDYKWASIVGLLKMMVFAYNSSKIMPPMQKEYLDIAQRFASYVLKQTGRASMRQSPNYFLYQCIIGEIIADVEATMTQQLIAQDPLSVWKKCWQDRKAELALRLRAMHLASNYLVSQNQLDIAFQYARNAVELVRFAHPPDGLDADQRERVAVILTGIGVDSCALAVKLGRVEEAVEILEQSRTTLSLVPDTFGILLAKLQREHPALFAKFDKLRRSAFVDIVSEDPRRFRNNPPTAIDQVNQDDFDLMATVLAEIREKPGFEDFNNPMGVKAMQDLAIFGPIVILVGSSLFPYAVVVYRDRIQSVDLSPGAVEHDASWDLNALNFDLNSQLNMVLGELRDARFSTRIATTSNGPSAGVDKSQALFDLLGFLWRAIVRPVNDILGFEKLTGVIGSDRDTAHAYLDILEHSCSHPITWIRTGNFSRLPFHVALDSDRVPFMFRAVSSYAASVQSIAFSNARRRESLHGGQTNGLFVTMPATAADPHNKAFLKAEYVRREVSVITDRSSSGIRWTTLERPSPETFKGKFPDVDFLHLVCHGIGDQTPQRSHLKLWKETRAGQRSRAEPLFTTEIAKWRTKKASLVFLSACSVADPTNSWLFDDYLSIASSFAVAGMPDVVGSIWPVATPVVIKIGGMFWENLANILQSGQAIEAQDIVKALQTALFSIFLEYRDTPLDWAGFIHIGGVGSPSMPPEDPA